MERFLRERVTGSVWWPSINIVASLMVRHNKTNERLVEEGDHV